MSRPGKGSRLTLPGKGVRVKPRRLGLVSRFLLELGLFKITPPGRWLFVAMTVAAMTGLEVLSIPVYHLFLALSCVALAASASALVFWPRCRVEGTPPAKAVTGRPVAVELTVTNRGWIPCYDLALGLFDLPGPLKSAPTPSVHRLGAGQSVRVRTEILPLRRGIYEFSPPRVFTTFPFNLFRTGPHARGTWSLMVLPAFHPLILRELAVSSRYQPGGISLTSLVGESPEYVGNREYRPGDSTRRIDSRSWARLAGPVVREYQEEYYCRVALVLDTYIPRGRLRRPAGFAEFEAAVSLAAAVADALSQGEYIIDLFAAGPELYVFRSGRHTAHLENVLEILSCLAESRRNPFATVAPALVDELANISTVIFVLLDWDADRRGLVRLAAETPCATKVLIVRRKEPTLDVAADEGWAGPITVLDPRSVLKGGVSEV